MNSELKDLTNSEIDKVALADKLYYKHIEEIPEKYRHKKFSDLEHPFWQEKVIPLAKEWDFKNPTIFSILSSQNGIGKTHLSFCLYKKYIFDYYHSKEDENFEIYLSIKEGADNPTLRTEYYKPRTICISEDILALKIRDTYEKKNNESELEIVETMSNADILLLDDIFTTTENNFGRKNIYTILNARDGWKSLPTIITSNRSYAHIRDSIDASISSRINNKYLIDIMDTKLPDYRPKESEKK